MFRLQVIVPSAAITVDTKATSKAMRQAATLVAKAARQLIRSSKGSGRRYGDHVASAPGQPPASDTGKLASSIRTSVKAKGLEIIARVIDRATDPQGRPYSKFLETGAVHTTGTRRHRQGSYAERLALPHTGVLAPRPYLSTALQQSQGAITDLLSKSVDLKLQVKR